MKIRYEFANGEISEVEVSEELGRTLAEMTHRAALRDRAETRRHVSLDKLLSLGAQISDGNPSVEELTEQALDIAALRRAVDQLEPQQKELLRMVYEEGRSCASIAREDGVSEYAVRDRLYRIHKNLEIFFDKPLLFCLSRGLYMERPIWPPERMNHGMIAQQNSLPIRASPYKHQQDAAAFALKHLKAGGGAALLMEMGTGKTITSIAVVGQLRNEGLIQRLLVICPVSVMGVWRDEFAKFAAYDYSLALLEGTTTKRADIIRHMKGRALQVLVLNYESVWRLEKDLAAWQPDMIVCDEGHKIKNHQAKASKALHRLSELARYRLLLTGTLITNKPLDVFSQYKFADVSVFGKSFYEFRSHFFDMVGYGFYTPVLKKSREAELTERIHSIAYRITKAECLDLPPYTDIVQKVDLEPSAQRLYRQLIRDCYAELAGGTVTVTNVLAQLTRLAQLTGGFLRNDQGVYEQVSTAKMDALSELVDSAQEDGRKLVVITLHRPEIDAISKMLDQKGIRHAIVHGGITGEERTKQVAAFQNDSGVTVFLGQIAAAGTGLTLTAATTMIFYSLDYNMSNYEQTRGRIHRISQNHRTTYIHLAARNTVDEKVLKALHEKADLAKSLVDDCRAGRNPFTE